MNPLAYHPDVGVASVLLMDLDFFFREPNAIRTCPVRKPFIHPKLEVNARRLVNLFGKWQRGW